MNEKQNCPKIVLQLKGSMQYNKVAKHPNWEKIKNCFKNDFLYK